MASTDDTTEPTRAGDRARAGPLADRYRAVFDAAPDGILIVDADGTICDANPAALRMFGFETGDLLGAAVEILVPTDLRERHVSHRQAYAADPHARPMGIGLELRGRRADGSLFPIEISLSPLPGDDGLQVIATIRDLTLRLRLRRLGAESLTAMEEERRRIALELHDDTAQRLSALLLMLRIATELESADERLEVLDNVREQLLEAAESVRRIARGLRPPALSDAGLAAAIRGHVRDVERATRIRMQLDLAAVDHLLTPDEALVVYRVVQEAVANCIRHSGAGRAEISVNRVEDRVRTTIHDDGRGFDPRDLDADRGLGLLGMQERAQMVGAVLEVDSAPGKGTIIRLDMPVSRRGDRRG